MIALGYDLVDFQVHSNAKEGESKSCTVKNVQVISTDTNVNLDMIFFS